MSTERTIETLAASVCDGSADEATIASLAEILRDNPDAQQEYLAYVDLHNSLRWMAQGDAVAGAVSSLKAAGVGAPQAKVRPLRVVALVLAAAAALGLAFLWGNRKGREALPIDTTTVSTILPNKPGENDLVTAIATGPTWASVVDSDRALWIHNGAESPRDLRSGPVELHDGIMRLALQSGSDLLVQAPARFVFTAEHGFQLTSGVAVFEANADQSLAIQGGAVSALVRRATFGLSVTDDVTIAGVLAGQTRIKVSAVATGRAEAVVLAREESVRALSGGGMLKDIFGDVAVFQDLKAAGAGSDGRVANASFEYPVAQDGSSEVAAAGWSFQVLPLMNASEMPRDDAVGMFSVNKRTGLLPPEGRQWAFLGAERLADGRYFHAAMHQRIELLQRGVTYRLEMTIAADSAATEPVPYVIGLYAGQPESVPNTRLAFKKGVVSPDSTETIVVRYRSPDSNLYAGLHLFVRAELLPPTDARATKLFIDNVRLELEEGESLQ